MSLPRSHDGDGGDRPVNGPEIRTAASPYVRLSTLAVLVAPLLIALVVAYAQWLTSGLPAIPVRRPLPAEPAGFPVWVGVTHYINLLFIVLLIRSGLQILMDHP